MINVIQPAYYTQELINHAWKLNSNVNLTCHINKEVATKRAKTDTVQRGKNFGLKRFNTEKDSPTKKLKMKQFRNYEPDLQRKKNWINSAKLKYKKVQKCKTERNEK